MFDPALKTLESSAAMSQEEADSYRQDFVGHLCQTVPGIKENVVVDAAGCYLKTAEGRILLDMISGIAVSNLGHCHPEVVKAVQDQVARFSHIDVYGRFTLPPQVEIARRLASVTPGNLDVAFLTSTGTEATEGALKLARKYTGRPGFVAFRNSFHGRTLGSLSVTWKEEWRKPFEPLLGPVRFVPFDDLEAAAQAIGDDIAAVIVEPIQGEGGVRIPSDGFLPGLRELCTKSGALMICDEVQGGMGRSGRWFSCQNWDVTPDVITVAKAFGGGLPLGAFISTAEIFSTFLDPPLSHLTTFGGNPVSCAAAVAAFDVIQGQGLVERAATMGEYLREGLGEVRRSRPETVTEVRGLGLWCAFDVQPAELAQPLVNEMARQGVVVGSMLNSAGTIRVAPPLVVRRDQIDQFLHILESSLAALPS
ncbi:MAG: aspartate aminotransferase family protein [Acidimicrobiia bacterium]|nr:aspartate aminotransferase family protein [bacterium]MXX63899.1 aspartate aminotransferase family protein [Acidimicrobiia bacterium]MCY3579612.1 aspartate aminotransferase family protein [bacterium]MCY3652770.1 aspartate aminotransferase family protein [bacterium]MXZ06169.1 aspartate aminotransferase family protein [Acidimicrobiia bacterium]